MLQQRTSIVELNMRLDRTNRTYKIDKVMGSMNLMHLIQKNKHKVGKV